VTPLLIVGASGRAAAESARRAGFTPTVIDLFADTDTRAVATCLVCPWDDYPHGIPSLAETVPGMPFRYTGGIENHPHVVAELTAARPLLGNGPDVLAKVRDPAAWSHLLRGYGFTVPKLVVPGGKPPRGGDWLRKPIAGAGGLGVRPAASADRFVISDPDCGFFLQERIAGRSMSAYFSDGFVGVSEQLVGEPWLHAKPFAYCGNLGPVRLPPASLDRVKLIGRALTEWAGLTGPWGFDFLLRGRTPVPVEINPRFPASAELYETNVGGKAVYYAPRRIEFPDSTWPGCADIPAAGSVVEPGHPVLTVFAPDRERLQQRAAELDRLFGVPG
jgi:uncharacterized protein